MKLLLLIMLIFTFIGIMDFLTFKIIIKDIEDYIIKSNNDFNKKMNEIKKNRIEEINKIKDEIIKINSIIKRRRL